MAWTPPPPPGFKPANTNQTASTPKPKPPSSALFTPEPPPPVPPAFSPAPANQRFQISTWLIVALVAGLVFGGYWYYKNRIDVPRAGDIQTLVEQLINHPGLSVKSVSTKFTSRNDDTVQVAYAATAEVTDPIYKRIATYSYLSEHGANPLMAKQVQDILANQNIKEVLAEAKIEIPLPSVKDWHLVKQVAPLGQKIIYTGRLSATRSVDGWNLSASDSPQTKDNLPNGIRLSELGGEILDVDKPENAKDLDSLVKSTHPDMLQKLKAAMDKIRARHLAGYLEKLQPGALFKGTATKPNGEAQILYLEISKLDTERQVITAALRNDGGWDDFRRLQGTYALDESNTEFSLTLNTRSEQAVQNSGPFLEWNENYEIPFVFDGDTLAAAPQNWGTHYEFKLDSVSRDQKDKVISDATETQQQWLAATKPGMNYRVLVTAPVEAWSGKYYFSFNKQDCNGASAMIEGVLSSANGWRKTFSGILVLNKYRTDGKPLRLNASDTTIRAAEQLDRFSPFALGGFKLYPQVDEGKLSCDMYNGNSYHWEFTPYSGDLQFSPQSGYSSEPPPQGASNPRQLATIPMPSESSVGNPSAQPGGQADPILKAVLGLNKIFEGLTRGPDGGRGSRVRFAVNTFHLDRENMKESISGTIRSLDVSGVWCSFQGEYDLQTHIASFQTTAEGHTVQEVASGGLIQVTVNGVPAGADALAEPWFRSHDPFSFNAEIGDSEIKGQETSSGWTLNLNPVQGSAAPEWLKETPKKNGVYWKAGTGFVSLPVLNALVNHASALTDKYHFQVDGQIPRISDPGLMLVHRGELSDLSANFVVDDDHRNFLIFKLGKSKTGDNSFDVNAAINSDSHKAEFDWQNLFGIGRKKIQYSLVQSPDEFNLQACQLTTTPSAACYAFFDGAVFYVFEYDPPQKK